MDEVPEIPTISEETVINEIPKTTMTEENIDLPEDQPVEEEIPQVPIPVPEIPDKEPYKAFQDDQIKDMQTCWCPEIDHEDMDLIDPFIDTSLMKTVEDLNSSIEELSIIENLNDIFGDVNDGVSDDASICSQNTSITSWSQGSNSIVPDLCPRGQSNIQGSSIPKDSPVVVCSEEEQRNYPGFKNTGRWFTRRNRGNVFL